MSNEGNRIIAVKWAIHKLVSFLARISMTGIDRIGLVNDITNIISSELKVNMTASISRSRMAYLKEQLIFMFIIPKTLIT